MNPKVPCTYPEVPQTDPEVPQTDTKVPGQQCDQIWLVPAKLAGFRVCVAGKNLRLAGGWFGWLLHKMNYPGLGIFLAIQYKKMLAGKFGWFQTGSAGFAEKHLVTLVSSLLGEKKEKRLKGTIKAQEKTEKHDWAKNQEEIKTWKNILKT